MVDLLSYSYTYLCMCLYYVCKLIKSVLNSSYSGNGEVEVGEHYILSGNAADICIDTYTSYIILQSNMFIITHVGTVNMSRIRDE